MLLAGLLAGLLAATGCSGTVSIDAPSLRGADARACAGLLAALPERVDDLSRRTVTAGEGYGAAWGDPAIELRCGSPRPPGFSGTSVCQNTNGVDWFIPPSQQGGDTDEVTMTTVGRAQNVEVRIPSEHFPPANTMVDLAPAIKGHLREVRPCL